MNNKISTMHPAGRGVRALVVAGIALSIACGSSALAQAGPGNAKSATDAQIAEECANTRPTLSRGSTGDCVYIVQLALYNRGFRGTPLDGIYGPITEQAVQSYQESTGLEADGIVGGGTWAALIDDSALPGF
ncbi:peptidoglycan-binding domain-containing protein [Nocardia carnea]|uniref:peptidoglycan-binding domain-containing protein n=1 Tax=Nocardia carnea TaxID=37328 RepID=UPI0024573E9D|nr:peptidoglycan-binding domain-containing protein [Nocardia carnea]